MLSCTDNVVENIDGDSIPIIWIGDTSEPLCQEDKAFRCRRKVDEVSCRVRIAPIGPNCTDSSVTVKLHGLCCIHQVV